ncbi:MAG: hypothetical protein ACK5NG_11390 [Chthoniobacterales bacterium]
MFWALFLALLLTCAWSLPVLQVQPDTNFVFAASQQEPVFLKGLKDSLFDSYGWDGVLYFFAGRQALILWGMLSVGLSIIFCGVALFMEKGIGRRALLILGAGIILISAGKATTYFLSPHYSVSESLRLPFAVIEKARTSAGSKPLYSNMRAFRLDKALSKKTTATLVSDDGPGSPLWAAAALNPDLWRKLERQEDFGAVLLIGPISEYAPLLEYLLDAQDWRFAAADEHGLIFLPGTGADWQPKGIPEMSSREDALAVSMIAENLARVRQNGTAHLWLDAAAEFYPASAAIAARKASFLGTREQWGEALVEANRALEMDESSLAAMQIRLQALTKEQNMNEAWQAAQKIKNAYPNDMKTLFLHARTANAVGATDAEIDSLQRLISQSEALGLPDGHYRIYLAQCYAKQGIAPLALEQINFALQAPGLSDEQRGMLEKTREIILSASGL